MSRRLLAQALHHFAVAIVFASCVFILEQKGLLNWLDSVALRTVGALSARDLAAGDPRLESAPRVLLIGDRYYERDFNQESPLDRRELARIVARLLEDPPRLLAVDIDLSPGPEGARGNDGQDALDRQLMRAVESGIPVIVTSPFPVADEGLLREKLRWMQRLCAVGVWFALPHVPVSQGVALRYSARQRTLGLVAQQHANADGAGDSFESLCQLARQGPEAAVFLSKAFPIGEWFKADDYSLQRPINPDYLKHASAVTRVLTGAPDSADARFARGRPVFLGAGYDTRDEFLTAHGAFSGTLIHASTYFTEQNPATRTVRGIAVSLDLFFGVVAGFLFNAVWGKANRAQERRVNECGSVRPWLLARGWQLLAFGSLIAWLGILFLSSAWLLQRDLWNKPGPMLVGVFVKALLASRAGLEGPRRSVASRPGPRRGSAWVAWLDWVLVSPFVIWAAVLFVSQ